MFDISRPRRLLFAALMIGIVAPLAPGHVAAAEDPLQNPDPANLIPSLEKSARVGLVPGGISVDVDKRSMLVFPFEGATQVTFDVEADGIFLLSWFTADQQMKARVFGPPWRYVSLHPGERRSLDLNLLEMPDWFSLASPGIRLKGTGRVSITRLRWRSFAGNALEAAKAHETALRFSTDAIGHTTINGLLRPVWSLARPTFVPEILSLAGFLMFVMVLLGLRIRRTGWATGQAATVAILAVAVAYDLYALGRLVPALHLQVEPDPDLRIRDNYYFAPEIGALSFLAREHLGPAEKVGVQGDATDWFGPQTICFNLAPHPCVILDPTRSTGAGISGVRHLDVNDLDAIVVYDAPDSLIPGFTPVAQLNRNAYVAHRIP
jgi:hypothetical protein